MPTYNIHLTRPQGGFTLPVEATDLEHLQRKLISLMRTWTRRGWYPYRWDDNQRIFSNDDTAPHSGWIRI